MKRATRLLIGGLTLVFLAGCASGPRGPINLADLEPVEEGYGYLAIGFNSNVGLYELLYQPIEGGRNQVLSRQVRDDKEIRFYQMPEGEYRLSRFVLYRVIDAYHHLTPDEESETWEFEIQPGKVNYLGEIQLHVAPSGRTRVLRMNHGGQFYSYLETQNPDVLEQLEVVYAGHAPDAFFEWANDLNIKGVE